MQKFQDRIYDISWVVCRYMSARALNLNTVFFEPEVAVLVEQCAKRYDCSKQYVRKAIRDNIESKGLWLS